MTLPAGIFTRKSPAWAVLTVCAMEMFLSCSARPGLLHAGSLPGFLWFQAHALRACAGDIASAAGSVNRDGDSLFVARLHKGDDNAAAAGAGYLRSKRACLQRCLNQPSTFRARGAHLLLQQLMDVQQMTESSEIGAFQSRHE